jgi:hypothetical protein
MNYTGYPQRTAQGNAGMYQMHRGIQSAHKAIVLGENFENESNEQERTIQLPQQHAEYTTPHNEQFALQNTTGYGRPGINTYNPLQHGDMHQVS